MITGTISPSDYLNAQRLHRAQAVRLLYLALLITLGVGIALYFFLNRDLGLIVAGASIGGAAGQIITSIFFLPRKVRLLHSQQKDLASPFTYKWNATFLEAEGISGNSKREWANYVRCREDEKILLLYHADNLFELFPKSWFPDQALLAEFRELAQRAGKT